jgi:hypothetical protein
VKQRGDEKLVNAHAVAEPVELVVDVEQWLGLLSAA